MAEWADPLECCTICRMRLTISAIICIAFVLSGCTGQIDSASAIGLPSPTPFQPVSSSASDSLYAESAPTPLSVPTVSQRISPPTAVTVATAVVAAPPEPTATAIVPTVINPLTGLPPADAANLNRRPMAIKVANYPRYIRPQSGLSLADQVFEYYIEGGLTRFIAVMYGNNSEWVGPVRSGRFFDEHIARMYQAYLVFKFADPRVLDYFRTTDIADFLVVPTISENCPPFHFMTSRNIEDYNNNYFNTYGWADCVARNKLPNNNPRIGSRFSVELPSASMPNAVKVYTYFSEYSYHYWGYAPETGEYLRYQEVDDTRDGKEESYALLTDNVNGQPVHAANVVILFAYHTFSDTFQEEDEVYGIDLTGAGEAYVFRDGVGVSARWNRLFKDQPLVLTTTLGEQILLKPGVTFYEVIGSSSYASQGDGEWFFHHATP